MSDPRELLKELEARMEEARELKILARAVEVALQQTAAAAKDLGASVERGIPPLEAAKLFAVRVAADAALIHVALSRMGPQPSARPAPQLPPSSTIH